MKVNVNSLVLLLVIIISAFIISAGCVDTESNTPQTDPIIGVWSYVDLDWEFILEINEDNSMIITYVCKADNTVDKAERNWWKESENNYKYVDGEVFSLTLLSDNTKLEHSLGGDDKITFSKRHSSYYIPEETHTNMFKVGDEISNNFCEFGATEFRRGTSVYDSNGMPIAISFNEGNEIVAFNVYLVNRQSTTLYPLVSAGWTLFENGAACYSPRNSMTNGFSYRELMPGGRVSGWVAWEVAQGADVVLAMNNGLSTAYIYPN